MGRSGGFLSKLLRPLLKTGLSLIGKVPKTLTKGSEADAAILIISKEEMNDIIKIIKSLEESGLLIEDVSETIKNEAKERKGGFFRMLIDTFGVSLLGNLLTEKGTIRAGEGTIRSDQDF